jgi:cytochrome b6-f complex iron-sulfur subunit
MLPLFRTLMGLLLGGLAARLMGFLGRFHTSASRPRLSTRRTFTRNATLGATGVVLAELGAGFLYFFWPNQTGEFGSALIVPAESVPEPMAAPYRDTAGKFYLVHTEDGLLAMYWKCVHLGCTVPWNPAEELFICPCHGSVYDYNGVRISGPAPRPLDIMAVTVLDGGAVEVNTGAITIRGDYEPEQTVPYTD